MARAFPRARPRRSVRVGPRTALALTLALLGHAAPVKAEESLAVVVLGAPEPAAPTMTHAAPGQLSIRPTRGPLPARAPPALALLVDDRPRILADVRSGTLAAAAEARVDLGQLTAVLLSSMRPAATAELAELLADAHGPSGTVRLVAPLDRAWPSPARWAEALFGASGLYPGPRAAPRSLRLQPVEAKAGAERRLVLGDGTEVRARARASSAGTVAAFRVTRGEAVVVLAGEVLAGDVPGLAPLAQGAGLLVAGVPGKASVQALAELGRAAHPRQLLVTTAGDEVRSGLEEARSTLEAVVPGTIWASTGRYVASGPSPAASPEGPDAAGCRSDEECGPGRVCMGCGDLPRTCIPGCRSKSDCPAGQACVTVQCVRCPCPPQCTSR